MRFQLLMPFGGSWFPPYRIGPGSNSVKSFVDNANRQSSSAGGNFFGLKLETWSEVYLSVVGLD